MKIHEPTTTMTDFLIAGCTVWFSGRLLLLDIDSFHFWWSVVFSTISLGAFLGAIRHGWGPSLGSDWTRLLNLATYAFVGLTAATMIIATLLHYYAYPRLKIVLILLGLSWLIYVWIARHRMSFSTVVYYYVPALIMSGALVAWNSQGHYSDGEIWIMAGMMISLLAGGVQIGKFSLHRHFNHNDLYHVIQLAGLFMIYYGVRLIPAA